MTNTEPSRTATGDTNRAALTEVESCCEAIYARLVSTCDAGPVPLKSVGISSVSPAAGVSTVAINVAIAAARNTTQQVVLVEVNWKQPTLAHTLTLAPTPGLLELFQGQADLPDCVRKTAMSRLHILPIGSLPDQAITSIDACQCSSSLEMLEDTYDLLVLDLPSSRDLKDHLTWLTRLSGIVLVVESGRTLLDDVREVGKRFQRIGVPVLGTVLNKS